MLQNQNSSYSPLGEKTIPVQKKFGKKSRLKYVKKIKDTVPKKLFLNPSPNGDNDQYIEILESVTYQLR